MGVTTIRAQPAVAVRAPAPMLGWLSAGLVGLAICAWPALSAHAQAAPPAGPAGHGPMGAMHHPGGGGGQMMLFAGPPEHIARHVDHMLDGLNATDAQRAQVKQIAQAAAADLKAQHQAGKALHDREAQVFAAPTVDANAAEAVRQQMLAQHDQASRRVLTAMLDISRVLTPEQRATLAARAKEREAVMQDRMQRMQRERAAAPTRS